MTIEEGPREAGAGFVVAAFVLAVVFAPAGFLFGVGLVRGGKRTEGYLAMALSLLVIVGIIVFGP